MRERDRVTTIVVVRWLWMVLIAVVPAVAFAGDEPSVFEGRKMGSASVVTSIENCQEKAAKTLGDEALGPSWQYCACMTDAMRVEFQKGRMTRVMKKLSSKAWLERRQQRCLSLATQPPKSFGAGAQASVFAKKELGSASVFSTFITCDLAPEMRKLPSLQRMGLCSCVADAVRKRYREVGQAKFLEESLRLRSEGQQGSQIAWALGTCENYALDFELKNKH